MHKGGRGAGVCKFEGEIGNLQVFKTELMCGKQIPAATQEQWDTRGREIANRPLLGSFLSNAEVNP